MARWALIITLPALWDVDGTGFPVAFFAVVSIAVIGLYIAYVIPIYLRWRQGDAFDARAVDARRKYKWMNPVAVDLGRDHASIIFSCRSRPPACRGATSSTGRPSTTRR